MYRTAVALLVLLPLAAGADDWPGWRGPTADGVSREKDSPVRWSAAKGVRWKVPVRGAGVSCPVVCGERVFLTASEGRRNDQLHVYCHHRKDGRLLWDARLFGSAPTDLYPPGGMAVPTPAADGKRLYALFGTGDLACLDFDGRPVWIRSLAEEYGPFRNRWGMGASPVLVGELLVVQVDHWSESYLLGLDAKTGATRWKTKRDATVNWTSPLPVKTKRGVQLVTVGTYRAAGYDARTGAELWTVKGFHQQCIPSPVAEGDLVFAASGEGTLALRLDSRRGDVTETNVVWRNRRARPSIPSPLVYRGHVYLAGGNGLVTCLAAATGKQVWKERLGEQEYHASPVAGAGKIYFAGKEGVVRVVEAGPKFRLLAENDLGEPVIASPALSGGEIFIRGQKHLFCVGGR